MTGETHSVKKESFEVNVNNNCFMVSGTKVVEGTGKMMVLTVGVNTVENGLKINLQQEDDATPLQEKLEILANQIGQIGMWGAALLLAALVVHLLIDAINLGHPILSI